MYELLDSSKNFLKMRPKNHPKSKKSIESPPCLVGAILGDAAVDVGLRAVLGGLHEEVDEGVEWVHQES